MKIIKNLLVTFISLFLLTVVIYWFNLDTKLVKSLEGFMTNHYDNLERDKRL